MKYFVFIIFMLSGFVQCVQFPSHKPEIFSEEDVQVLIKPFTEKAWQHRDQKYPFSSDEYTQAQKTLAKTLKGLVDMYHSTFPNPRSIQNANNPAFYPVFSHAVWTYSSTMLLLVSDIGKSYVNHGGIEPGYLRRVYKQNCEGSLKQFQRLVLTVFSNIAHKGIADISYPCGSMHLMKKDLPIHYFWDENGPVPFALPYQKPKSYAKATLSYGQMKEAIPRLFVVGRNQEIITSPGFFMMKTEMGIQMSFSRGLITEESRCRVLDARKKQDLPGLKPEHDSFTGFYNKAGSFSVLVQPRMHKKFGLLSELLGTNDTNFIAIPSEQELQMLYLDQLDAVLENPEAEENQAVYQELLAAARDLPAIAGSLPEDAERETPEDVLRRVRDEIKQSLLADIVRSGNPEEDAARKADTEATKHARKSKASAKGKKKKQGKQKRQQRAASGGEAAATAGASADASEENVLDDLRAQNRVKFKSLGQYLNRQARSLGLSGRHFLDFVRHKMTRHGSHLTVGDQTLAVPHGGDNTMPAAFVATFVEGVVEQFQNHQQGGGAAAAGGGAVAEG